MTALFTEGRAICPDLPGTEKETVIVKLGFRGHVTAAKANLP